MYAHKAQNHSNGRIAQYLLLLLLILSASLLSSTLVHSASVTLAWDKNTESNLAGYRLYCGYASKTYNTPIPVAHDPASTSTDVIHTFDGVQDGKTHFFVVTAYDTSGNESDYSQELVCHTITPLFGAGGSISPAKTVVVSNGSSTTFAITPNQGYEIEKVLVDGVSVGAPSSYTFSNVSQNRTIRASFRAATPVTYTISASAGANGTITPSGSISVTHGSSTTFTITPNAGYRIADVKVDGVSVGTLTSYTFSNVSAPHSISATFASIPVTYNITASAGANGYIFPSGTLTVNQGASQTFTITPNTGYTVAGLIVDGKSVTPAASYTFSNVTANHTISATFVTTTQPATVIRVNTGGANFTDSNGNLWAADKGFNTGRTASTTHSISGTTNGALYQSERWDPSASPELTYSFDVPNGDYTVNLHFAEIYNGASFVGGRVFNVYLEGKLVTKKLDIFREVGHDAALIKSYTATVTDGVLTIQFAHVVENPKISAIEILSAPSSSSAMLLSSEDSNNGADDLSTITDDSGSAGSDQGYEIEDHTIRASFAKSLKPPVCDAGSDQEVESGTLVTLNGSNSFDLDGTITSYLWTQTGGSEVILSDPASAETTFTAPFVVEAGEALIFSLLVRDNLGLEATDSCIVNVVYVNRPPLADAGSDQTVVEKTLVTLDGSKSSDPDDGIESYLWKQTGGPLVILSDSSAAKPTFIAPDVSGDGVALPFELTVTDKGGLQSVDTCTVNVTWQNLPPHADAGKDQTVYPQDTVVLDGSASTDPDDGISLYHWTQTSGTPVTLSDPTSPKPFFTALETAQNAESLIFSLTVTDHGGLTSTASCTVTVQPKDGPNLPAYRRKGSFTKARD